jgi:hypothetical protein
MTGTDIGREDGALEICRVRRDLFCFVAPLRLPIGPQRGVIDFLSPEVNPVDPPRVGNVFQGIRIEEDEIGAFARHSNRLYH